MKKDNIDTKICQLPGEHLYTFSFGLKDRKGKLKERGISRALVQKFLNGTLTGNITDPSYRKSNYQSAGHEYAVPYTNIDKKLIQRCIDNDVVGVQLNVGKSLLVLDFDVYKDTYVAGRAFTRDIMQALLYAQEWSIDDVGVVQRGNKPEGRIFIQKTASGGFHWVFPRVRDKKTLRKLLKGSQHDMEMDVLWNLNDETQERNIQVYDPAVLDRLKAWKELSFEKLLGKHFLSALLNALVFLKGISRNNKVWPGGAEKLIWENLDADKGERNDLMNRLVYTLAKYHRAIWYRRPKVDMETRKAMIYALARLIDEERRGGPEKGFKSTFRSAWDSGVKNALTVKQIEKEAGKAILEIDKANGVYPLDEASWVIGQYFIRKGGFWYRWRKSFKQDEPLHNHFREYMMERIGRADILPFMKRRDIVFVDKDNREVDELPHDFTAGDPFAGLLANPKWPSGRVLMNLNDEIVGILEPGCQEKPKGLLSGYINVNPLVSNSRLEELKQKITPEIAERIFEDVFKNGIIRMTFGRKCCERVANQMLYVHSKLARLLEKDNIDNQGAWDGIIERAPKILCVKGETNTGKSLCFDFAFGITGFKKHVIRDALDEYQSETARQGLFVYLNEYRSKTEDVENLKKMTDDPYEFNIKSQKKALRPVLYIYIATNKMDIHIDKALATRGIFTESVARDEKYMSDKKITNPLDGEKISLNDIIRNKEEWALYIQYAMQLIGSKREIPKPESHVDDSYQYGIRIGEERNNVNVKLFNMLEDAMYGVTRESPGIFVLKDERKKNPEKLLNREVLGVSPKRAEDLLKNLTYGNSREGKHIRSGEGKREFFQWAKKNVWSEEKINVRYKDRPGLNQRVLVRPRFKGVSIKGRPLRDVLKAVGVSDEDMDSLDQIPGEDLLQ